MPVMVAGLSGTAVSLFLFAGLYWANRPGTLIGLLVARVIYGVLAGGIQPVAIAAIADTTTAEKRSAGAALVGAAVGLGSIVGPVLIAALVGFGLPVPVLAAGIVMALAAVATVFGVRDGRQRSVAASASAAASFVDGLRPYLWLAFAMVLGFSALQPTMAFYVQDRFNLDTAVAIRETGLASASFAACSFVVQALVVRFLALTTREPDEVGARNLPTWHRRWHVCARLRLVDHCLRRARRRLRVGAVGPHRCSTGRGRRAPARPCGRSPAGRDVRSLDRGSVRRHRALRSFDRGTALLAAFGMALALAQIRR